jgi:hypothetical protein
MNRAGKVISQKVQTSSCEKGTSLILPFPVAASGKDKGERSIAAGLECCA